MAKQTFTTGQVLTAAQMTSLQQTAMGGGAATAKTASYVLVAADAGTTVAMNAAGATTITVNTGLFAAGDTVFIQNLGAGACTVTAGTATVATAGSLILPQNDAGILYFTSASAAIFYDYIQAGAVSPLTTKGDLYTFSTSDARLGVGANNTVLTADSAEATGLKWAAPAASGFVGCSISKSASQSISNNTGTFISFDTEAFDTNTFHDNSTNNSRITIPAGKSGYYQVNINLQWNANTTGARYCMLYKNGTTGYVEKLISVSTTGGYMEQSIAIIMDLVATDYIELKVDQSSGGSLDVWGNNSLARGTSFSVQYLGA